MRNLFWLFLLVLPFSLQAGVFPTFDGRFYNGLFYPTVDPIEWGEQNGELPHMEFHLHNKDKRIELTTVPGDKGGRPVLWLMYDLTFRGERVCRRVLAPSHFQEGMKLYTYRDDSDPDYDNIFVSSEPMNDPKLKPYVMAPYEPCSDEHADNKPDTGSPRSPASVPADGGSAASAAGGVGAPGAAFTGGASGAAPSAGVAEKKDGKNIGVDYDNHAVPFSF